MTGHIKVGSEKRKLQQLFHHPLLSEVMKEQKRGKRYSNILALQAYMSCIVSVELMYMQLNNLTKFLKTLEEKSIAREAENAQLNAKSKVSFQLQDYFSLMH